MSREADSAKSPLRTVVLFAAGTIVLTLGAALVMRVLSEQALEQLARLASGESDYEHRHPRGRS